MFRSKLLDSGNMNRRLVIIPTYNERENVAAISAAALRAAPDSDLLFVDDNSPDGTGALADQLAANDPRIRVLHREGKQGLGRAYIAGFQWALRGPYEFVFEMDADFSHHPDDLNRLHAAAANADLALGSRYIHGIRVINWPLSRLLLSMGAAAYVRAITGMPFTDPTGGFKCYRRTVLETIPLDRITSNGYAFQVEMTHTAWRLGFRVTEIPIVFEERRSGVSKMSGGIVREALGTVWKLWARNGFRRRPDPRRMATAAADTERAGAA